MSRDSAGRPGRFAALSRTPERRWPDGFVHHGARILFLMGLAALTTFLNPPTGDIRVARYTSGVLAEADVLAQVPFSVPLSGIELDQARNEARSTVPVTFDFRPAAADSMESRLDLFLGRVAAAATSANGASAVQRLLAERSVEATPAQVGLFLEQSSFGLIRNTAISAIGTLLPEGVADGPDLSEISTETVTVRSPGGAGESSMPASGIRSAPEFYAEAVAMLPASASPDMQEVLRLLLIQHIEFTYQLNLPATETDRDVAARALSTTKRSFLQGEAVVRANEQITPAILESLTAHEIELRSQGLLGRDQADNANFGVVLGTWILNMQLLGVFGMLLFFFRAEIYTNFRWITMVAILIAFYFVAEAVVLRAGWPVEALPIAFVALSMGMLWDGRMALVLVMTLAVVSGLQPGFTGMNPLVPTLIGGSVAALGVRAVRRRSQTWLFIAIISAGYGVGILTMALITGRDGGSVLLALGAATANAVLSAIVAMGFLPVFEWFTGITTDQTLLEWADPHRSLLKRLSMEAPGTYAHTINVANLAETAAETIGANSLLCRVGMFYHDVGKMLKPHYFVENQQDRQNPHDRLKPDMSASIVKAHVTEGLRLAREAKVPDVVVDFIAEHHGTQRIGFFWQKAVEEYGEAELRPEDFTYPGPRPRSRETAIAMLADSVESATRALQDPTPDRIRGLIDNIVDGKIADGQLDDSPMTLQELAAVKGQFAKVLTGVLHQRIDYPDTRHLTQAPKAEAPGAEDPESGSDGKIPGPSGSGKVEGGQLDLDSSADEEPEDQR